MGSRERAELRGIILDGRYRIGPSIGTGGTGVVFEAERLATLEKVVVKTLRPVYANHADLSARLKREVEVARRVFHPGIVPVIDDGTLPDGSPYVVMRYLRSESLSAYVRRSGPLSMRDTAVIGARVASVLHSVHAKGYVHRDVKPEHVLLNRNTFGDLEVHLIDFGVCAADTAPADERARESGRVFGTPSYSSPEQATGNPYVDGRADLFGLGATMFEALTARLPFTGPDVNAVLRRIIREDAPRVALLTDHVDSEMDEIVATLLSRSPELRFASARGLMRALDPWLSNRIQDERLLAQRLVVGNAAPALRPTARAMVAA